MTPNPTPTQQAVGPRGDALLSDNDASLLAHAITIAREVQEFIWAECYPSLRPYDAQGWRRLFQKRVDCIAQVDLTKHGGLAALRKRLLQQAALSIKALALVNRWAKTNPPQIPAGSDGADLSAATASPTPAERKRGIFDAGFSAESARVAGEQENATKTTDWLGDMEVRRIESPSDSARRAAEEIVPDCLSRTCFMEDCGYDHCWGCDDSKVERERVAAIISKHFTAAPADNDAE